MNFENEDSSREFWSTDHRFGLRLGSPHITSIINECTKSYPNETGGILVGFYNKNLDCAEVTKVFFEPRDSRRGKTWFVRGVYGLQHKLNKLWLRQKGYYLGEWHFHPRGTAIPSPDDINQMFDIAASSKTHCPEPILLIFAGTDDVQGISYCAFIFPNEQVIELVSTYANSQQHG